jgi:hypothetical protein
VGQTNCINTIKQKRQAEMVSCLSITDAIITTGLMSDNETRKEKENAYLEKKKSID